MAPLKDVSSGIVVLDFSRLVVDDSELVDVRELGIKVMLVSESIDSLLDKLSTEEGLD